MTSRIASPDTKADEEVRTCLDAQPPRSFVMVAGAGSGKTTSLVKALAHIVATRGKEMTQAGRRVACITYTEIAATEIATDVANASICHVSTIHSFLWTLIRSFTPDIREWLEHRLRERIDEEQTRIAKPRTREATKVKARQRIERLTTQLASVDAIERFGYATGSDYSRGILGHDDVVKCALLFLTERPLLRGLLASQFPIVFVDESQDTNPDFVAALKLTAETVSTPFCIGAFGDPMQKIYLAGIGPIAREPAWVEITKPDNFRSPQAVLKLINRIRADDDGLQQTGGRSEATAAGPVLLQGSARLFLLPTDQDRNESLMRLREWMASANCDPEWSPPASGVKVLVLVHRSAATRLGFAGIYGALNDHGDHALKQGLLDGTAWVLRPFLNVVLPLVDARRTYQEHAVVQTLLAHSPAVQATTIGNGDVPALLGRIDKALDDFIDAFADDSTVTVGHVLKCALAVGIVPPDERLSPFLEGNFATGEPDDEDEPAGAKEDASIMAFLACPVRELAAIRSYIENQSPFDTHQGIKGAEFERVLAVLDDEEARYNLFSYTRYFGLAPLSKSDLENARDGKETTIDRTRRLFYVCCSRARRDLAVALFVPDPDQALAVIANANVFPVDQIFTLPMMALRASG